MRINHLTLLALITVAAVAVFTAGGCSQAQAPVEDQPIPAPGAPTPDVPDTSIPPVMEPPALVGADVPVVDAAAVDAPAGADLTTKTLTGTSWQAGPLKLAFGPDGSLTINDTATGSWKVDGQQLIVEGAGTEYKAQIKGDTLYYGEMPLVKIQ